MPPTGRFDPAVSGPISRLDSGETYLIDGVTERTLGPTSAVLCQRWRERRDSYRPAGEPIRASEYHVGVIDEGPARAFVEMHHYSGTFPAARLCVGLFRSSGAARARLVGTAVFSVPMNNHSIPVYSGLAAHAGVELGRFVLLDECEANAETWFLARAFRGLRTEKPEVKAVLSYSDPLPRATDDGRIVKPGHMGICYQALNARHVGRSSARTLILDVDGRVISERALSKIRNDERGAAGAYRRLISAGAPPRRFGEDPRDYVTRAVADGPFRRVRHPGNFVYLWSVGGRHDRQRLERGFAAALPYPKAA